MSRSRRPALRAVLGALTTAVALLLTALPAAAATDDDCGGGELDLLQSSEDLSEVVGVRVHGLDAQCDGQPVGVQFLGNADGDPAQPAAELARAYSDEDQCTGAPRPDGVLHNGAVEVLLCEGATTSGPVDGRQLTQLRLITTLDDPAPGGTSHPDGAPAPAADGELPMTGADILRAAAIGAVLVLAGSALVRRGRRLVRG